MSATATLAEAIERLRGQSGDAVLVEVSISPQMYKQLVEELGREDIQHHFGIRINVDPDLDALPHREDMH